MKTDLIEIGIVKVIIIVGFILLIEFTLFFLMDALSILGIFICIEGLIIIWIGWTALLMPVGMHSSPNAKALQRLPGPPKGIICSTDYWNSIKIKDASAIRFVAIGFFFFILGLIIADFLS